MERDTSSFLTPELLHSAVSNAELELKSQANSSNPRNAPQSYTTLCLCSESQHGLEFVEYLLSSQLSVTMCVLALQGWRSRCECMLDVCEEPTAVFQTCRTPAILHGLGFALHALPGECVRLHLPVSASVCVCV